MVVDKALFRAAAGSFASGVTVITSGFEGSYHGITASAFTSLSLEPTQVLVCINRDTRALTVIKACGCFCVNILDSSQEALSRVFASRDAPQRDGLEGIEFAVGNLGVPVLSAALAFFESRVVQEYDGGDHVIMVGEVERVGVAQEGEPLLYFRGGYRQLSRKGPVAAPQIDGLFSSGWRREALTPWGGLPD
ncbi:MAG: flavin reductase [Dehalococcoidia bacterium]|nr:flavin reductase [Dehalococcoidia bacterium]